MSLQMESVRCLDRHVITRNCAGNFRAAITRIDNDHRVLQKMDRLLSEFAVDGVVGRQ